MLTTCNKEIIFLQWKWRWENRITLLKLYSCGKWVFMPSSLERKFISLHQLTLLINNLCIKYTNWEAQGVILLHVLPFHIAKLCFSEGGENLCPILHQKKCHSRTLIFNFLQALWKIQKHEICNPYLNAELQSFGECACRSWLPWGSGVKDMTDTNPVQAVQTQEDSPVLFFLSNHEHKPRNFFQKMN